MTIAEETQFAKEELEALFSSVRWESAKYHDRLVRAMRGFSCVLSAREEGRLVGLLAAMDDGEMTAYIHYLLVAPEAQGRGVGSRLLQAALARYRGYTRVVLHTDGEGVQAFYRKHGFSPLDSVCMGLTPRSQ